MRKIREWAGRGLDWADDWWHTLDIMIFHRHTYRYLRDLFDDSHFVEVHEPVVGFGDMDFEHGGQMPRYGSDENDLDWEDEG